MDLGFKKAGFQVIRGNEKDKFIWETYQRNHPDTILDTRDLRDIPSAQIPDYDGIIG